MLQPFATWCKTQQVCTPLVITPKLPNQCHKKELNDGKAGFLMNPLSQTGDLAAEMEYPVDLEQYLATNLNMLQPSLMELLMMDQTSSMELASMELHSSTEPTSLVNKDIEHTEIMRDEIAMKHLEEFNLDDALALLNTMESESVTSQTITNTITLQASSNESSFNFHSTTNFSGGVNNAQQAPLKEKIGLNDISTPVFLANMQDLLLDVATPDVDTTVLTDDIPEFFSGSMEENCYKSSLPIGTILPKLSSTQQEVPEIDCSFNVQAIESPPEVTLYDAPLKQNSSDHKPTILTLNVGQSNVPLTMGKGARLQLKRKASKSDSPPEEQEAKKICVKQDGNGDNVMTIIIKIENGEATVVQRPAEMSVSSSVESDGGNSSFESTAKKAREENRKYAEMRKKNNEASRRSRRSRKEREKEMAGVAEQLVRENEELREKVKHLEKLKEEIKAKLVDAFRAKSVVVIQGAR